MSKLKDTDFLFISTRLRSLENRMLTRERMERMLEARTNEDAVKVLAECGYEGLEPFTAETLEQSLAARRESVLTELSAASPQPELVDVFRCKYDYHNAKAIIKCAATGQDPDRLLTGAGRYPAAALREAFLQESPSGPMAQVMAESADVLSATGDPQRSDFVLDRAYFRELGRMAAASGSEFLSGYVRLLIDAANLKSAVRAMRLRKGLEFLNAVLVEGGNVEKSVVAAAANSGGKLEAIFTGALQEAAALGDGITGGGSQTAFERACDNALNRYLQSSRMTPFGADVVIAYAAAIEAEITAARIILSGRLAGVSTTSIRERLREAYV